MRSCPRTPTDWMPLSTSRCSLSPSSGGDLPLSSSEVDGDGDGDAQEQRTPSWAETSTPRHLPRRSPQRRRPRDTRHRSRRGDRRGACDSSSSGSLYDQQMCAPALQFMRRVDPPPLPPRLLLQAHPSFSSASRSDSEQCGEWHAVGLSGTVMSSRSGSATSPSFSSCRTSYLPPSSELSGKEAVEGMAHVERLPQRGQACPAPREFASTPLSAAVSSFSAGATTAVRAHYGGDRAVELAAPTALPFALCPSSTSLPLPPPVPSADTPPEGHARAPQLLQTVPPGPNNEASTAPKAAASTLASPSHAAPTPPLPLFQQHWAGASHGIQLHTPFVPSPPPTHAAWAPQPFTRRSSFIAQRKEASDGVLAGDDVLLLEEADQKGFPRDPLVPSLPSQAASSAPASTASGLASPNGAGAAVSAEAQTGTANGQTNARPPPPPPPGQPGMHSEDLYAQPQQQESGLPRQSAAYCQEADAASSVPPSSSSVNAALSLSCRVSQSLPLRWHRTVDLDGDAGAPCNSLRQCLRTVSVDCSDACEDSAMHPVVSTTSEVPVGSAVTPQYSSPLLPRPRNLPQQRHRDDQRAPPAPHVPELDFSSFCDGPLVRHGQVVDASRWRKSEDRLSWSPSPFFSLTTLGKGGGSHGEATSGDEDDDDDELAHFHRSCPKAEENWCPVLYPILPAAVPSLPAVSPCGAALPPNSSEGSDDSVGGDKGTVANPSAVPAPRRKTRPCRDGMQGAKQSRAATSMDPRASSKPAKELLRGFLKGCNRDALRGGPRRSTPTGTWPYVIRRFIETAVTYIFRMAAHYLCSLPMFASYLSTSSCSR